MKKSTVASILEAEGWPLESVRRREAHEEIASTIEGCPAVIDSWRRRPFGDEWDGQVSFVRVTLGEFEGPTIRWGLVEEQSPPLQVACGVRWSMIAAGFHEIEQDTKKIGAHLRHFFRELPRYRPRCPGDDDWQPINERNWPFNPLDAPPLGQKTWALNAGGGALTAASVISTAVLLASTSFSELIVIPLGIVGTLGLGLLGKASLRARSLANAHVQATKILEELHRSRIFDDRGSLAATKPAHFPVATDEKLNELIDLAHLQCAQITATSSDTELELRLALAALDWPEGISSKAILLPPSWAIVEMKGPREILELVPRHRHEFREPERVRWLMGHRSLERGRLARWLKKLDATLAQQHGPYR